MKFRTLASSGLALLATVTLTACSGSTTDGSSASAPQPASSAAAAPSASSAAAAPSASSAASPGSSAARTGTFKGDNGKHVAGTATVSDGKIVLAGFSSDAGPDLHIYLTNGSAESNVSAGKQLGVVAADKDSQTFSLGGIDPSAYTNVVIHCDKAKAVFGDAPLS
ncbi:MAG TPA: DM13 domain-containing protein [Pseudonocardia sp.]|nr:DM13 domain-containing protein [Pseudonocardia sp.]